MPQMIHLPLPDHRVLLLVILYLPQPPQSQGKETSGCPHGTSGAFQDLKSCVLPWVLQVAAEHSALELL